MSRSSKKILPERRRSIPAIALTAFAHKDDVRRVLLSGFQVHVPKPADPHLLVAMVASLPNAELIEFASQNELFGSIPQLVERVSRFLS